MESPSASNERRLTFPREHRLKRRRLLRPLFDRNRSDVGTVAAGCVRLLYRIASQDEVGCSVPIQIGFAPGRTSGAVVRNRIRRIMREVYRVNQHVLVDLSPFTPGVLTCMVLFRGREGDHDVCIPKDLPVAMKKLADRLREESPTGVETAN